MTLSNFLDVLATAGLLHSEKQTGWLLVEMTTQSLVKLKFILFSQLSAIGQQGPDMFDTAFAKDCQSAYDHVQAVLVSRGAGQLAMLELSPNPFKSGKVNGHATR